MRPLRRLVRATGCLIVALALVGVPTVPAAATDRHRPAQTGAKGPVGWDTYRHPERLAELADAGRTSQYSSFDRTGGNNDGFDGDYSCLRTTSSGCVIAQHSGPGEIDSIWFTRDNGDVTATGDITITLDGATVVHANLQDVVDGRLGAPFVYPLVANADQSSGGVYVKVPMPFTRSMVITTDANPIFYHVTYRHFVDAAGVTTFDPGDPATDVLAVLKAAGTADPKPAQPGATTAIRRLDVAPGATVTLATERGPGAISALRLALPQLSAPGAGPAAVAATDRILAGARLRVSFDGTRTVDAPLGEFFGTGLGLYPVRALYFGVDPAARTLTAWWLMPYRSRATVTLYNGSDTPITAGRSGVTAASAGHWARDLAGRDGYFRATANRSTTRDGADHTFLATAGHGRLLGVSQTMIGKITSGNVRDYLEGDERLYVDSAASPDMHGTGTEDFYESGWYFNRGTYSNPLNGNTGHEAGTTDCANDCTSAYRLMLGAGPSFATSIDFGIEHGPGDHDPAIYGSTAYWYGQPTDTQRWTDSLTVGDHASEAAHGYRSGDPGPVEDLTATYEGNDGAPVPLTASVRGTGAAVSFRLAVAADNRGVTLRRTSDQDRAYQAAEVSVNGRPAGRWTQPLGNATHRWLDDSYRLPPGRTRGRSAITVTLTPVAGSAPWTAARYQALSSLPAFADTGTPGAVSGVHTVGGSDSVSLSWTPARDDVYAPAYQVYASSTDGFTPGPDTLVATSRLTGFTHTGLGIAAHRYYRIRAVDAAGHHGRYSAQVSGTSGDTRRIEAESLLPPDTATAPVAAQSDCCGVRWSGGAQLWFTPTAAANTVRVSFTLQRAGRFALSAVQTEAPDYGVTTLAVDGSAVGDPFDGYHAGSVSLSDPIDLGEATLSAGTHTLDLTVTGRDDAASNYYAGLDYLALRLVG